VDFKRTVYVSGGLLSVGLGTAGLFLPLLPTTPLLLLAAFLFARSSERWHRWLLTHKRLGPYIHAFRGRARLTRQQKFQMCVSFTVLFGISIYLVPILAVRLALAAWCAFWIVFIYRIKSASGPPDNEVGTPQLEAPAE